MRRPEARSAGIDRPDGVTRCFQVSANKVEPSKAVCACNLLAKETLRLKLADEPRPVRPEMALITESTRAPCGAEGLTGETPGPDGPVVGPASETQGVGPDPNPGAEMDLGEPSEIVSSNIDD